MALESIGEGWKLFTDSFRVLFKKPIFLIPIFFSWILVAGITLYLRYYWIVPANLNMIFASVFLVIFLITLIICVANIMMLEFMQQIESGEEISFFKAFKEATFSDLLKTIPVALIWAIVWFILLIIRVLTSRKRRRYASSSTSEPSPRDAALTLSGANSGPFSWLGLGLKMFEKLVRMYIFLTLPAIAWENKGPFSAFGRSLEIIKRHPMQFLTTYTLTSITSLFMAIPLIIIIYMDRSGVAFSSLFWTGVIIYEGIIWTLGIYLEQMSVGLLYLWHMKWIKFGSKGELSDVPKPDLLDESHELNSETSQPQQLMSVRDEVIT